MNRWRFQACTSVDKVVIVNKFSHPAIISLLNIWRQAFVSAATLLYLLLILHN